METIKLAVEIKLDFSDSTKAFISALLTSIHTDRSGIVKKVQDEKETTENTPIPDVKENEVKLPKADKPTEVQEMPKTVITIEEIRNAVMGKVNDFRDEIKAKLSELNAPSVSKISPDKYEEFYNFINSL